MTRQQNRATERKKRKGQVHLGPGEIIAPISGMTHWGPNGENLGVWGRDKPVVYMGLTDDGVRELTEVEQAYCQRVYGPPCAP